MVEVALEGRLDLGGPRQPQQLPALDDAGRRAGGVRRPGRREQGQLLARRRDRLDRRQAVDAGRAARRALDRRREEHGEAPGLARGEHVELVAHPLAGATRDREAVHLDRVEAAAPCQPERLRVDRSVERSWLAQRRVALEDLEVDRRVAGGERAAEAIAARRLGGEQQDLGLGRAAALAPGPFTARQGLESRARPRRRPRPAQPLDGLRVEVGGEHRALGDRAEVGRAGRVEQGTARDVRRLELAGEANDRGIVLVAAARAEDKGEEPAGAAGDWAGIRRAGHGEARLQGPGRSVSWRERKGGVR